MHDRYALVHMDLVNTHPERLDLRSIVVRSRSGGLKLAGATYLRCSDGVVRGWAVFQLPNAPMMEVWKYYGDMKHPFTMRHPRVTVPVRWQGHLLGPGWNGWGTIAPVTAAVYLMPAALLLAKSDTANARWWNDDSTPQSAATKINREC